MIADIVAENQNGVPILVVKVSIRPNSYDMQAELRELLIAFDDVVHFAMTADLRCIQLFQWKHEQLEEVARLDSRPILAHYDPTFDATRIFQPYLTSLVEAWLRDFVYHWKSPTPPGRNELRASGLVERLAGGTTKREVTVHDAAIH